MRFFTRPIAYVALGIALTLGAGVLAQPLSAGASANAGLHYTTLTLINGWTGGPFSTRVPAIAKDSGGTVHLEGAMATLGTNPAPFTLATGFRPSKAVYVAVDLCDATNGR